MKDCNAVTVLQSFIVLSSYYSVVGVVRRVWPVRMRCVVCVVFQIRRTESGIFQML